MTRPWCAGDLEKLRSAESLFSARTLSRRFHSGTRSLPPSYLRSLERPSLRQAAVHDRRLVGLAECVWPTEGGGPPDLAIMIADDWQRHGLGRRLVVGLVRRCVAAGVRQIEVELEAENVGAVALARSVTRPGVLPGCWTLRTSAAAAYRHLAFSACA